MSDNKFNIDDLIKSAANFRTGIEASISPVVPHVSFEDNTEESNILLQYVSQDNLDNVAYMSRVIVNYILAGTPMTEENMSTSVDGAGSLIKDLEQATREKSGYENPCLIEAKKQQAFPDIINSITNTIIDAFAELRSKFSNLKSTIKTKQVEHQLLATRPRVMALQNIPAPTSFGINKTTVSGPPIQYTHYDSGAQTSHMASFSPVQTGYQGSEPRQHSDKKSNFLAMMNKATLRK